MIQRREGKSAPSSGREKERMHAWERERENILALLFICFFLPPGPALCKLGLGWSAVLPEVLTPVLGPSFDLPLLYFLGLFPSCLLATTILDSFSLFELANTMILIARGPNMVSG